MAFLAKIRTNKNSPGALSYDEVKLMTDSFLNQVMSMDWLKKETEPPQPAQPKTAKLKTSNY